MIIFSAISVSVFLSAIAYYAFKPLPKVSKLIAPYDSVVRVRLSGSISSTGSSSKESNNNFAVEFFKPMYESLARVISKVAAIDDEKSLDLKLEQAGLKISVESYRTSVVKNVLIGIFLGLALGLVLGNPIGAFFFPCILAFSAFAKTRGALDKKIENRRATIRSELYTFDQLLALHIKTGSGVSQALIAISSRTSGILSDEIKSILSRARSGVSIEDSLYIAARSSPEPHAKRTYKLLAAASNRGVDLTDGLLDLAKDLRRSLREEIKATGVKRRAAMLLPTIGILAPIMLLFVAAPIPSIVLTGR